MMIFLSVWILVIMRVGTILDQWAAAFLADDVWPPRGSSSWQSGRAAAGGRGFAVPSETGVIGQTLQAKGPSISYIRALRAIRLMLT